MRKSLHQIGFFAGLIAIWQIVALLKIWPPYLFPTPASVWESLHAGFADHSFWIGIGVSMKRVALGYAVSCIFGVALGFATAYNKFLSETVGRMAVSLQSLPSICWLPMAILWFGLTEKAILFVVIMGSLLAITISVQSGLRSIPKIYPMAGRNLGARGWRLILYVLLPASLPHLTVGLKQGWAFAWRSLISGEMIFVTLGLGQLLMMGRDLNDISQVFAVMILIVAIGWLVDTIFFRGVERALQNRWGFATN
ncbi:MAG TPA: ABC transporter permease [Terriglobales bacterium]|nr:ABC transporter permease [Terriglobales bacterium]